MADADLLPPRAPARSGTVVAVLVLVGCMIAIVLAVLRVTGELARPATESEMSRAAAEELVVRWRVWPAGRIFPPTISYAPVVGDRENATRVGIGADTSCVTGVDPGLAAPLAGDGCAAALRATYLDELQGLAITVGVLPFPGEAAATRAARRLPKGGAAVPGLRALPLGGSAVSGFGDAARQTAAVLARGPYLVIAVVGYADGRPAAGRGQPDLVRLAPQIAQAVLTPLATPARPDCAARERWTC